MRWAAPLLLLTLAGCVSEAVQSLDAHLVATRHDNVILVRLDVVNPSGTDLCLWPHDVKYESARGWPASKPGPVGIQVGSNPSIRADGKLHSIELNDENTGRFPTAEDARRVASVTYRMQPYDCALRPTEAALGRVLAAPVSDRSTLAGVDNRLDGKSNLIPRDAR